MEYSQATVVALLLVTVTLLGLTAYLLYRVRVLDKGLRETRILLNSILQTAGYAKVLAKKTKGRPRKRYIVYRIISEKALSYSDVEKMFKAAIRGLYGEAGLAESRIYLAFHEPSSNTGVVRISADWRDRAIIAISLIRQWEGRKLLVVPLRTTGSIKRARELIRDMS